MRCDGCNGRTTREAEARISRQFNTALFAGEEEAGPTLIAELGLWRVVFAALGTLHHGLHPRLAGR